MEFFQIVVLSLSGLMLFVVGLIRTFQPSKSYCLQTYLSISGVNLHEDADMSSEMRGIGAFTFLAGVLIGIGAIFPLFRLTSFVVAVLIFLGFALGRLLSLSLDGKPNQQLLQGLFSEVLLGGVNLACLILIF